MVKVKPFAAIRPPKEIVKEVASRPYDVLNSQEAKAEAGEKSLLHIIKPEIDFDPIADEHEQKTYDKAVENFKKWQEKGWLVQDKKEQYYVYAQTMDGRTQYGLVVCANTDDYMNGAIKKHELTRKEKEDDRMIHIVCPKPSSATKSYSGAFSLTIFSTMELISALSGYAKNTGSRLAFWILT